MNQSLAQQQNALANQANASNAFGGSRQGIQAGVLGAQGALGEGQMAAQLNAQNFQQAQAAAEYDINTNLQGQQLNQAANLQAALANQGANLQAQNYNAGYGLQAALANAGFNMQGQLANQQAGLQAGEFNTGMDMTRAQANAGYNMESQQWNQAANQASVNSLINAATGLGGLGTQAQAAQRQNFLEQTAAGQAEQQQAQNEINANLAQFQSAWNYPNQELGTMLSALGMTPYGTAQSGTSNTNQQQQISADPFSSALSALGTVGSLFGSGGMFSGLSDRRLKTDIAKVDTHPSGLPIYSFRYKGDPKSYPKVVGPMAEDVMKVAPHAVHSLGVGGRLGVDMSALGPSLPQAPMTPPSSPSVAQGLGMLGGGPPGALSAPVPMGGMGALGRSLRNPRGAGMRMPRPKIAGAMGGLGSPAGGGL
jgi:hypothetical protein